MPKYRIYLPAHEGVVSTDETTLWEGEADNPDEAIKKLNDPRITYYEGWKCYMLKAHKIKIDVIN